MNEKSETPTGLFHSLMRCLFGILYFIPAAISWTIDRCDLVFAGIIEITVDLFSMLGQLFKFLPMGILGDIFLQPLFIIGYFVKQFLGGLLDRAEWFFGSLFMLTGEVIGFAGQLLGYLPWRYLNFIIEPLAIIYFAVAEQLGKLAELSEWLTGEVAYGLVESVVSLFQLMFTLPICGSIRILRRLLPDWIVDGFFDAFIGLPDFVGSWLTSRDSWKLLFGTPAVLMSVPVVFCILISMGDSPGDKMARYRGTLSDAIQDDNQELTELCLARLNQLGYQEQERENYRAALLVESLEGPDAAYPRVSEAAEAGFRPAKFWVARHLLSNCKADNFDKLATARRYLQDIVAHDPRETAAFNMLAETYVISKNIGKAISCLESVAKPDPFTKARLMELSLANGNIESARRSARDLATDSRTQEQEVTRQRGLLRMAKAHLLNGNHQELQSVLQQCIDLYPDTQQDKHFKSLCQLAVSDNLKSSQILYPFDPENPELLDRLSTAIVSQPKAMRDFVTNCIKAGNLSPKLMMLAGDKLSVAENFESALRHYRLAAKLDETNARAWNNVAWLLSNVRQQHELALVASNKALELDQDPDYFDTRGQIFGQLARWEEARADLEIAMNGDIPDLESTHKMLSKTYRALGLTTLATAYSKRESGTVYASN